MRELAAIVAMDSHRIIGANGGLPWHLPADLKRFAALTTGHTVMMGSTTWRGLPDRYRPLPRRSNVIITRSADFAAAESVPAGVIVANDPIEFSNLWLKASSEGEILWIIGGAKLYASMIPLCSRVELTIVDGAFEGDTYLEPFEDEFTLVDEQESDGCKFLSLVRNPKNSL